MISLTMTEQQKYLIEFVTPLGKYITHPLSQENTVEALTFLEDENLNMFKFTGKSSSGDDCQFIMRQGILDQSVFILREVNSNEHSTQS